MVKPDDSQRQLARELVDAAAHDVEQREGVQIDPDARTALVEALAEKPDVIAGLGDPTRRAAVLEAATAIFSRGAREETLDAQESTFAGEVDGAPATTRVRAARLFGFRLEWPWPIGAA